MAHLGVCSTRVGGQIETSLHEQRGIKKNQPLQIILPLDFKALKFNDTLIINFLDIQTNGDGRFSECKN